MLKREHNHLQEYVIGLILKLLVFDVYFVRFEIGDLQWPKVQLCTLNIDRCSANKVTLVRGLLKREWANSIIFENPIFPMKAFQRKKNSLFKPTVTMSSSSYWQRWWKNLTTWKKIELFFSHDINLDDVNEVDDSGHVIFKRHISPG